MLDQLDARKIANRYAKALFDAAQEQGVFAPVDEVMREILRVMTELPELGAFFENPGLPISEKLELLQTKLGAGSPETLQRLFALLAEQDRMMILPQLAQAWGTLSDAHVGVMDAEVTVPTAIDQALQDKFAKQLAKLFDYQDVRLTVTVDPAILAGAIVKIGDKIIDGSYHGKLHTLKTQVG